MRERLLLTRYIYNQPSIRSLVVYTHTQTHSHRRYIAWFGNGKRVKMLYDVRTMAGDADDGEMVQLCGGT